MLSLKSTEERLSCLRFTVLGAEEPWFSGLKAEMLEFKAGLCNELLWL